MRSAGDPILRRRYSLLSRAPVRFLLLLAWWVATEPNQTNETDIALDRVWQEIEKGERQAADALRRRIGSKRSGKTRKRQAAETSNSVVNQWNEMEKRGQP
jgi:hypothetical protein